MQDARFRKVSDLIEDFDGLRAQCERIADRLRGLSLLFCAAAALVVAMGLWIKAPIFAVSAGFALAAALVFAASAHMAGVASRSAPRIQRAVVPVRVERRREAA